jgi:hypothetical protein
MKVYKAAMLLFLMATTSWSSARDLHVVTTKVNFIRGYAIGEHAEMDTQIRLDFPCPSNKDYYYMEKSGDHQTMLSLLLSALAADKQVQVHYETNQKSNISGNTNLCRIYSVGLIK